MNITTHIFILVSALVLTVSCDDGKSQDDLVVDEHCLTYPQIKDIISQRETGAMRMQFWADTIDSIYKVRALLSNK